jgi:hypothetical protein
MASAGGGVTNNPQEDFNENALAWDPTSREWRTLDQCVWKSRIPLKCKFELTSAYDEADIAGLFHTHLQAGDLTPNLLIDELEFLRDTNFQKSV